MTLEEYVDRLLAGDEPACMAEGRARSVDLEGLHRFYIELVGPSQYMVGELWESGQISVATEHLATALNTYVAAACHAPLARVTPGGPRGMVACSPGEMHELGARILADLLECEGWAVDFFGRAMPSHLLVEAIRERNPRFLGLSTALPIHLASTKQCISDLREALGDDTPPIIVGGGAYRSGEDLWERVGADLYAPDAVSAISLLREFVPDQFDTSSIAETERGRG